MFHGNNLEIILDEEKYVAVGFVKLSILKLYRAFVRIFIHKGTNSVLDCLFLISFLALPNSRVAKAPSAPANETEKPFEFAF